MLKVNFVIVEPNSMGRLRWANDMARAVSLYPEDIGIRISHLDTRKLWNVSVGLFGSFWTLPLRHQKIAVRKDELTHIFAPIPFVPKHDYILGLDDLFPYKQLATYQKTPSDALIHARNLQSILAAPNIQVLAQYLKDDLIGMCGKKEENVHVVPAPINMDKFHRRNLPREDKTLLYVGDEHPRKNLPRLLQAIASLKDDEISLVWTGEMKHPKERHKVRNLAKRLGVNLREEGFVSDERLVELYNTLSLSVYPCVEDAGFGLPPVEAAACGLPSAVSDVPPIREVLGNDLPVFFDPLSVESIAEGIEKGLSLSLDRWELRESVSRFDFPKVGRRMIEVYQEVGR